MNESDAARDRTVTFKHDKEVMHIVKQVITSAPQQSDCPQQENLKGMLQKQRTDSTGGEHHPTHLMNILSDASRHPRLC